jgi:hypothetical protein
MNKQRLIEIAESAGGIRNTHNYIKPYIMISEDKLPELAAQILLEAAKVCLLQGETKGNCDAHFDATDWCHSAIVKMAKELTQ